MKYTPQLSNFPFNSPHFPLFISQSYRTHQRATRLTWNLSYSNLSSFRAWLAGGSQRASIVSEFVRKTVGSVMCASSPARRPDIASPNIARRAGYFELTKGNPASVSPAAKPAYIPLRGTRRVCRPFCPALLDRNRLAARQSVGYRSQNPAGKLVANRSTNITSLRPPCFTDRVKF